MIKIILSLFVLIISLSPVWSWWESSSTWDSKRGRYVSTSEYKKEHHIKDVCQSISCYDIHSGHFKSGDEYNKDNSNYNKNNSLKEQR